MISAPLTSKEEPLGTVEAEFFAGRMPFLLPDQHNQSIDNCVSELKEKQINQLVKKTHFACPKQAAGFQEP